MVRPSPEPPPAPRAPGDLPRRPDELSRALVVWFERAARQLPWREERTPYRVWLSEVMLQQTRVATVVDYFERFVARFPSVEALASAELDDVLGLWSGLGYYARGRNLHRAARVVADELGGRFPDTAEGLARLPGIGPYTAGAIASLAFGRREPIVDGNVARVLMRLCDDDTPIDSGAGREALTARARALVEAAPDAGVFNEGLMELGALVCTPRSPGCERCPWRDACRGHAKGTAAELPVKLPKRARKSLRVACVLVTDGDHVWLERREERGLFGGLYEPPGVELVGRGGVRGAVARLLEERGVPVPRRLPGAVRVERTLTHRDLTFEVVRISTSRVSTPGRHWRARDELSHIGLSSAVRAILDVAWPPT